MPAVDTSSTIAPSTAEAKVVELTHHQSIAFSAIQKYRFVVLCAGRRGGKSYLLETLIDYACREPEKNIWYIAPTRAMAKSLVWEPLSDRLPQAFILKKDETSMYMRLHNGTRINLFGAERPDNLAGRGIDLVLIDEAALIRRLEPLWSNIIRIALADREGKAVLATTPRSYNYYYNLASKCWNFPYSRAEAAKSDKGWFFHTWTTLEGGQVGEEELEELKQLPPALYRQELLASFENLEGVIYSEFERLFNVDEAIEEITTQPILAGMDFNVNPMVAILASCYEAVFDDYCHVFDEIVLPNSDTYNMVAAIERKYPGREIIVYPDASARNRHASAQSGITCLSILQEKFRVVAPKANPPVIDRINVTKAMVCDHLGVRRLKINPRCRRLIMALTCLQRDDRGEVDKSSGHDHYCDALGYMLWSRFNLILGQKIGRRRSGAIPSER